MDFKKYGSIENAQNQDIIRKIKEQGFYNEEYVVQEKVHGANVCFITNGKNIISAKRTAIISADEKFYNLQELQKKYETKIIQLFNIISKKVENISQLAVYGELFGGLYAHPAVLKVKSATRLQKGIYYSPDNDFYAFDIRINNEQYLDTDTINGFFEEAEFFYAKTLFRGTLDDCLAYPNEFQSQIAVWLGLPQIENNTCEGVVIRPVKPLFFKNRARVMLKNKNEKWAEKSNYSARKAKKQKTEKPLPLSNLAQILLKEISTYINENRLNSVLSKIGQVSQKDRGKLQGMLGKDA